MITDYAKKVKRALRDIYEFVPTGGTEEEPIFDHIPDGEYPMEIDGKHDNVIIRDGRIDCCNFD